MKTFLVRNCIIMTIFQLPIEFEHRPLPFLPLFLAMANDDCKIIPYLHWTDSGFLPHE